MKTLNVCIMGTVITVDVEDLGGAIKILRIYKCGIIETSGEIGGALKKAIADALVVSYPALFQVR